MSAHPPDPSPCRHTASGDRPVAEHGGGPRIGSLCTGYGGLDLAVERVLGGHLTWYAETDPHAKTVCEHHWPHVANLGDIRHVDWSRVEPVEILTAGFPCQDISNAGKRAGITGEHSSVWTAVADAVRILRPPLVFVENVAALLLMLSSDAGMDFDLRRCVADMSMTGVGLVDRLVVVVAPMTDRRRSGTGA